MFAGLISLPVYVLPYAFVYGTPLLMEGTIWQIAGTTITGTLGVILAAYALVGKARDRLEVLERGVVFVAAILLIAPSFLFGFDRRRPGTGGGEQAAHCTAEAEG